jgi:small-conductance mechanosensitive channel
VIEIPQPTVEQVATWLAKSGLTLLVLIVTAWVVVRLLRPIVHRVVMTALDRRAVDTTAQELSAVELRKRVETIEAFVNGVVKIIVVVVLIAFTLAALGLLPALAGLTVLGAALAIVLQDVIRDYLNGVFIILENHFAIGDVVRIAGASGAVEELSLRRTTLRDLDGAVHIVPNGQITVASNLTRTWGRINLDVTVVYGTDVDRAIAIVDAVGVELAADPVWKRRVLEPPSVSRVEAFADYGITLKVLGNVRAADRWAAAGELRKRLLEAFAANGIELPRPARVVLAGDPVRAGRSVTEALPSGASADGGTSDGGTSDGGASDGGASDGGPMDEDTNDDPRPSST